MRKQAKKPSVATLLLVTVLLSCSGGSGSGEGDDEERAELLPVNDRVG